jgi:hypothetical protein
MYGPFDPSNLANDLCVFFPSLEVFILTHQFKNDNAHWQKWFPHLNQNNLPFPSKNGMVKNMLALRLDESLYKACQEGKHIRTRALCASEFRALRILNIIHASLCGLFLTMSFFGSCYFLTNHTSQKYWVFFLVKIFFFRDVQSFQTQN